MSNLTSKQYLGFELKGMDKLEKKLKQYADKELDTLINKLTLALSRKLLALVKKNSPVITGELRRNWRTTRVHTIDVNGTKGIILYNNTHYALYVEYGHKVYKKKNGQKVVEWLEGQHFLKLSCDELKKINKKDLEQMILKSLKKYMKG